MCPFTIITRLRHYFLTYKDIPGEEGNTVIEAGLRPGRSLGSDPDFDSGLQQPIR